MKSLFCFLLSLRLTTFNFDKYCTDTASLQYATLQFRRLRSEDWKVRSRSKIHQLCKNIACQRYIYLSTCAKLHYCAIAIVENADSAYFSTFRHLCWVLSRLNICNSSILHCVYKRFSFRFTQVLFLNHGELMKTENQLKVA